MGAEACTAAVLTMPIHMANMLLREAFRLLLPGPISAIIGNWPLHTLCMYDVLLPEQRDTLNRQIGADAMLFKGMTGRTRKCKMQCLDLTRLKINFHLTKIIVQMFPILSLRPAQMSLKKITNLVIKHGHLNRYSSLAEKILPRIITDLFNHDVVKWKYRIDMGKGQRLVIKMDRVSFSTQNTFFTDYMITNCLTSITPVTVAATNIIIKSELNVGDEIIDSLAPFIVFRGQHSKQVEGIWLENLEDNVFFVVTNDLAPFTSVRALGLPNCNISLQEGKTRSKTQARKQFVDCLVAFPQLERLDVSLNCFCGVFEEVVEALPNSLVYLNVKECDLYDQDIECLARSRHAATLRHLNLTRICGLFPNDDFAVSCQTLVDNLKYFVNVTILHVQQNHITDSLVPRLCETIRNLTKLKLLNMMDNILSLEKVKEVTRACAGVPSMQVLKLPYAHNLLVPGIHHVYGEGRKQFETKIKQELQSAGREDIQIVVEPIAYALFPP